jgi:phosphatidylserine/phosphatidylglycerophosphate/cardiolipin synthase-like enzyme
MMMMWVYLATGFMGACSLWFAARSLHRRFGTPLSMGVFFSPKGGCQDAVVRELRSARHEVLVQAYSFTADPITLALVDARKRGVHVDILLDRSNEGESYSELHVLLEKGLTPLIDSHHPIAHNKVMVIDSRVVITGSFNFTNQAEHENAENLVVIKGHLEVINRYRQNFLAHKAHSQAPNPKAAPAAHRKAA